MSKQKTIHKHLYDSYNKKFRNDLLCGTLTASTCQGHGNCGTFFVIEKYEDKNKTSNKKRVY